jgi:predicted lipid-binding transport protein (Tim44 family)
LGENVVPIDIIILAALAGFIIWRLWGALGRREGHENPTDAFGGRGAPSSERTGGDNVVPLPETRDMRGPADLGAFAEEGSDLAHGLTEVRLADRTFDPSGFLGGARQAYEMIVTAFAAGDRAELKPLLSDEVYDDFDHALRAREAEGQRVDMTFIGLDEAELTAAGTRGRMAEVTVKFVSEIVSYTKNADGVVIEGDPTTQRKVTDVWTFARDTSSTDPNWLLVTTDEG